MNILIVDGNEKTASNKYINLGMDTQYEVYSKVLQELTKDRLNITVIHPAINSDYLPKGLSLDDFEGVAWTGSLLNIYDTSLSISRQIELAKNLMNKKNIIFGSCWGLQVLVTAAGGKIRKNPKGLEAIISKKILLNDNGENHSMYYNKPKEFNSFCWHYDEVEEIPLNSNILASNEISDVQSLTFKNLDSEIWAVQYHPEFNPLWMSQLMLQRKNILLENKIFNNQNDFYMLHQYLADTKSNFELEKKLSINKSISDDSIHYIELKNWLEKLYNSS